ncbi:MAG: hypothetical protein ACE14W_07145 [Candidatus Velamenicoccus archaeovorus]
MKIPTRDEQLGWLDLAAGLAEIYREPIAPRLVVLDTHDRIVVETNMAKVVCFLQMFAGDVLERSEIPTDALEEWDHAEKLYLSAWLEAVPGRPLVVDVACRPEFWIDELLEFLGGGRARTRTEMLAEGPDYAAALRRWEAFDDAGAALTNALWSRAFASSEAHKRAAIRWER